LGNSIIASVALGGLCALLAWTFFGIFPRWAPVSGWLALVALLTIPVGLLYLFILNLMLGASWISRYNLIEAGQRTISVFLFVCLVLLGMATAASAFAAATIVMISACAVMLILCTLQFGTPQFRLILFRRQLPYGFRAYLSSLFSFLVIRSDLFLVQSILGPEHAGHYSITVTLGDLFTTLPTVIGTVLFPSLSALSGSAKRRPVFRRAAMLVAAVMLLAALVSAVLVGPVVPLLFGSEYDPAIDAFLWLLPGLYFLSVNTIYMNYFASEGNPLVVIYAPATGSIVNFILNVFLIHRYGINGAAIASSIAYGVMLLCSLVYAKHKYT
jgi:O-antigen/teichoic acid export membrane protein